jgi:hypothetical protein
LYSFIFAKVAPPAFFPLANAAAQEGRRKLVSPEEIGAPP